MSSSGCREIFCCVSIGLLNFTHCRAFRLSHWAWFETALLRFLSGCSGSEVACSWSKSLRYRQSGNWRSTMRHVALSSLRFHTHWEGPVISDSLEDFWLACNWARNYISALIKTRSIEALSPYCLLYSHQLEYCCQLQRKTLSWSGLYQLQEGRANLLQQSQG